MANEYARCLVVLCQVVRRADEVGYIAAEVGIGKVAFALSESGKVEAEDSDATEVERAADVAYGGEVFAAGEAVGKYGVGVGVLIDGHFEAGGELLPVGIGEGELDGLHEEGLFWRGKVRTI